MWREGDTDRVKLPALLFSRTHSGAEGLRMHRTRAAGTWMCARAGGEGPDVVCVHGLGVSGRYFVPLGERLRARARVHIPDLRGFGLTPGPRPALGVRGLAAALDSWMAAVGVERATLVGNSFGCQIAVELAVTRPERVQRLVLNGPTATRKRGRRFHNSFGSYGTSRGSHPLSCPSH